MPIQPEKTLGILGGGQLGRMFCHAAQAMGYRTVVFDPDTHSPAGQIADIHVCADYHDDKALSTFNEHCDVITIEFENIPSEALTFLAQHNSVFPDAHCLQISADRAIEKTFCNEHGLQTTPFAIINTESDIAHACDTIEFPAILKTSRSGYDGKGQIRIQSPDAVSSAFHLLQQVPCVLEQMVDLACEVSVVLARKASGETSLFNVAENIHRNGILDVTITPARIEKDITEKVTIMAEKLAEKLNYIGVMTIEFFISKSGEILINEIAPRTHNSGHVTLNGALTSQFEQQIRAICDLPFGSTHQHTPCVMVNLLGEIWPEPDFATVLKNPDTKVHLYGKLAARKGRKMGHINCLGSSVEEAISNALEVKKHLGIPHA